MTWWLVGTGFALGFYVALLVVILVYGEEWGACSCFTPAEEELAA